MSKIRGAVKSGLSGVVAILLTLTSGGVKANDALYEAAKKEGELVLYSDQTAEVVQAMVDGFTKRYPGIETSYFRGESSQVVQRFETESAAGRHEADLISTVDRRSKQLVKAGLLAPYESPELAAYPKNLWGRDFMWSPYSLSFTSLAWNTDLVKGDDVPKSFQDLLDPKWKGKLAMQDPLQGGGAKVWIVTMYEVLGEEKWAALMKGLAAQDLKYNRYFQVQDMVAAGEAWVQVAAYPNYIEPLKARGAPVEWGVTDPILFTALSLNLSKNASHPSAAKLFIDYMLSKEGQDLLAGVNVVPALAASWPEPYRKLEGANLVPQAHELEVEKADFFTAKIEEFFGKR